jgi:hypothetical protein
MVQQAAATTTTMEEEAVVEGMVVAVEEEEEEVGVEVMKMMTKGDKKVGAEAVDTPWVEGAELLQLLIPAQGSTPLIQNLVWRSPRHSNFL